MASQGNSGCGESETKWSRHFAPHCRARREDERRTDLDPGTARRQHIAIVFLFLYLASDLWSRRGGTLFKQHFSLDHHPQPLWVFCGHLDARLSRRTGNTGPAVRDPSDFRLHSDQLADADGDSRYIIILLFPVATAAFVNWESSWQALMGLACLVLYGLAWMLIPVPGDTSARWAGLFAAIALAQCISVFIGEYRRRIDAQIDQLKQAATFREAQIATMAHDIRSPVAAIAGFVDLLDDDELGEEDRKAILSRIGTTAWLMDLTVSNVLDLYQISGGHISAMPTRVDPNRIVADAASNCAPQAIHKGLRLSVQLRRSAARQFRPAPSRADRAQPACLFDRAAFYRRDSTSHASDQQRNQRSR